ncbi:DMT family transporter [Paludibacterium sp. THUN1379]|uniref:DMT family transporter n=1 Tax=Paludibacterium sp. THUN1379 TaxID=3112107 RepID=UPI003091770F|nr:DMT family transporter [Paludibacterium sp. THUN1379]
MTITAPSFFQRKRCAACLLLAAVLFWAGNVVVARAFSNDLPPLWLTLGRWACASLLLCPLAASALRQQYKLLWQQRWHLLWLAATGIAANNALIYMGVARAGVTSAAALQTLTPVWIVLLSALRQRLPLRTWAGVMLAMCGAVLIAVHGDLGDIRQAIAGSGTLWLLAASLCWAGYTLGVVRLPGQLDPGALLATQAVLGSLLLLPLALWLEPQGLNSTLSRADWLALAYLALFPSVLAYAFYRRGADRLGATFAGNCMNLMPPMSALLSMIFLGEHLQTFHVIGFAAIMAGLALGSSRPLTLPWRMQLAQRG